MGLPGWIAHADWGASAAKRVVATAELRGDEYVVHAPRLVGGDGELVERMHVAPGPLRPALLGFDFPIGLPRAYAELAGIDDVRPLGSRAGPGGRVLRGV